MKERIRQGFWVKKRFVATLLVVLFCSCSGPGSKGVLEVKIKDHRNAIGDFASAKMHIQSIRISPKAGIRFWRLGWITLVPDVAQVDLIQYYVVGRAVTIFKGTIDAGSYEAFNLKVRSIEGLLKANSALTPIANTVTAVALPFTVDPGGSTRIILDLSVMDMSDHPPQAYELQLVGYEVYENGKLINKIPPG